MEDILLPSKIEITPGENSRKAILTVEPCFHGYGTTLGNALRRVMLSSLPGAAVTAAKIKGVQHEFSPSDGVKEDVLEVMLNLKALRLRVFTDEPVRLMLKVKGEKEVTAADIEKTSEVEIVNPDLHIATLTDKKAELEMEIFVSKGRGYMAVEQRDKEKLELGTMAIDSVFSPIRDVGYKVENVRVGQITNYDKLVMNIETDGTIAPEDAVDQSVKILADHFALFSQRTGASAPSAEEMSAASSSSEESAGEASEEGSDEPKKAKKASKKKK